MRESEDAGELKSFEARLASLSPREDRLDRERLMFLMGQASERAGSEPSLATASSEQSSPSLKGRGNIRVWQAAFGGMSAVAATLLCVLIMRPGESGLARHGGATTENAELALRSQRNNAIGDDGAEVLVVRDVYAGDIEGRLSRVSAATGPAAGINQTDRPALTPTGWRSVVEPSTSSEKSGPNSTVVPAFWRIQA
jgi:hypothetical protein